MKSENNFQQYMRTDKANEVIKELVLMFHPEATEKQLATVKISQQYEWVLLKGMGKISIGMKFRHGFHGMGIKLSDFEKAYREGKFEAWKFYDDCNYISNDTNSHRDVTDIMNKHQVPRPSPKQMFEYYYED